MHQAQSNPSNFKPLRIVFLGILILFLTGLSHAEEREAQFTEGISLLLQKNFNQKENGIPKIATSGDKLAEPILTALLDGKLYRLKKDNTLVYATIENSQARITAALNGDPLGSVKKKT